MERITVHKLDAHGHEVARYSGRVLERGPAHAVLQANFARDSVALGAFILARGDRLVEWFYADRWYNVFAVYGAGDDHLRGWYCNVCRPARLGVNELWCEDLELDLVVSPDGHFQVLDEAKFAQLELPPDEVRQARRALAELRRLATERSGPFAGGGAGSEHESPPSDEEGLA